MKSITGGKNFALVYDPGLFAQGVDLERYLSAAQNRDKVGALATEKVWRDNFEREDRINHIVRDGVWVNVPETDGWILIDPVAQAPVSVSGFYSWANSGHTYNVLSK